MIYFIIIIEFLLQHQVKVLLVYEAVSGLVEQQSVVCYINNTCVYVTVLSVLQVVMKLVRLLPDGHRMKREVDLALDSVSETMTPLHYHLREVIICSYRQVEGAPENTNTRPCPKWHPKPLRSSSESALSWCNAALTVG